DVIIREDDCSTEDGIWASAVMDGKEVIEPLTERLTGRVASVDIINPETNEVIMSKGIVMTEKDAQRIVDAGIEKVKLRSVLTCGSKFGVCSKCYGSNLANGMPAAVGESVGIIAAQSIGEPGTQLTMRTFHLGGIANADDITQGLPRIEELFEARKPKTLSIISEISGLVRFEEDVKDSKKRFIVIDDHENGEEVRYLIEYGSKLKITEGDRVEKGDILTEGSVNPHDVLRIQGDEALHNYLIGEVQRVYRMQGVDINDKHIEVIVRQMMKKVKIDDSGSTEFLSGSMVDRGELKFTNRSIKKRIANGESDLKEATYTSVLLGITKASLATDSFLSAASFQETTRVLTDAAIKGKSDPLIGLKENVIIGKLIPAGTGLDIYNNVQVERADIQASEFFNQSTDNYYSDDILN
ncbi:MAG: DNA-directed RNA polymerase subunit beta', partial [Clostridia bacterium]